MSDSSYKTRAVVLYSLRHNERGIVLHLYTEKFGRIAYYIASGGNGRPRIGRSRVSIEPLSLLDIVAAPPRYGSMHRISEAKNSFIPTASLGDMAKASISMFLAEVLYKTVQESQANQLLFDYLWHSVRALDGVQEGLANFHLYFMVNLCGFLGYSPRDNYTEDSFFDIERGEFVIIKPQHDYYIDQASSEKFNAMLHVSLTDLASVRMNRATRVYLLSSLITFINIHTGMRYRISSLEMLSELF